MPEVVTHDGCKIAYEDIGTGPIILFIHGWAMSGRVWHYQREAFIKTHRIITLDLRGHGNSDVPATGPGIDDFAADLVTLISHLDLQQITLIAWSMGVTAALRAYPVIKDKLVKMILVGGTPCFVNADGFTSGLSAEDVRGMGLRLKRNYGRTMEEFFRGMFAGEEIVSDQYKQIVQDIVKG